MDKKIINQLNYLMPTDGFHNTYLKHVKLYKLSHTACSYTPVFNNWILFAFQGSKKIKIDNVIVNQDKSNYLLASISLAISSKTFAKEEEPFLGMVVDFDINIILQLLPLISKEMNCNKVDIKPTYIDDITPNIKDTLFRLISILSSKEQCDILGEGIIKELHYWILTSSNSYFLSKLFHESAIQIKIAQILKTIQSEYHNNFSIEELAKKSDMSVSSFHTYFKKITADTPYQYIKKLRLTKARDLIMFENMNVNEVALSVGYKSSSQFSREFKSFFGYPPKEAKAFVEEYRL